VLGSKERGVLVSKEISRGMLRLERDGTIMSKTERDWSGWSVKVELKETVRFILPSQHLGRQNPVLHRAVIVCHTIPKEYCRGTRTGAADYENCTWQGIRYQVVACTRWARHVAIGAR
jgi:hypothetical protein